MMAIDQETTIDDPDLFHVNSDEQFLKTRAELRATFQLNGFGKHVDTSIFEQACDNTLEIADKCEEFKPDLEPKLPKYEDAADQLVRATWEGFVKRGLHKDKKKYETMDGLTLTYREQLELELKRFITKDFASYFLITQDLVNCSLEHGWPLGPARGSAGGSLVCYCLGIHSLDPIKWGLSFNRFLSPARGGKILKVTME
jgi:DNA polymerase-3 subunit alpha